MGRKKTVPHQWFLTITSLCFHRWQNDLSLRLINGTIQTKMEETSQLYTQEGEGWRRGISCWIFRDGQFTHCRLFTFTYLGQRFWSPWEMPALAPQTQLTLLALCSTLLANGAPPTGVWNSQNTQRHTNTCRKFVSSNESSRTPNSSSLNPT